MSAPSDMETTFPVWDQAAVDADLKAAGGADGGKYTDEAEGLLCPEAMKVFIDVWKRPEELLQGQPDVPMITLDPEAEPGPNGKRSLAGGELFSGTQCVEWLYMSMRLINERPDVVNAGDFLWENIYPKGGDGLPAVNPTGKYAVRMWVMNSWRCVTVDDRIPVDLFGRSTLVGIRPLMLWPFILTKAVMKMMRHYRMLDAAAPDDVPAVPWLSGWERENLGVTTTNGVLYDRLLGALRVSKEQALPTAFLRDRAAPDRPPPRMIVLCGASGVGKRSLVNRICEELPERFGAGISNTSRPPKEHEIDGTHYWFSEKPKFDADVEENLLLEHIVVNGGSTKKYRYGTSLQAVRTVAAAGKLVIMGVNVDGIKQLKNNPGVDAYFIYVNTSTEEMLRDRLRLRLKEDESTVQKRLAYVKEELAVAVPEPDPAGDGPILFSVSVLSAPISHPLTQSAAPPFKPYDSSPSVVFCRFVYYSLAPPLAA